MKTVKVKISAAIAQEYDSRCPEGIPDEFQTKGTHDVPVDVAKLIYEDAAYNSDKSAQDIGEYGMPLGTFNAYRALRDQLKKVL